MSKAYLLITSRKNPFAEMVRSRSGYDPAALHRIDTRTMRDPQGVYYVGLSNAIYGKKTRQELDSIKDEYTARYGLKYIIEVNPHIPKTLKGMATARKKTVRKSPATKIAAASRLIKTMKADIAKVSTMLSGIKPAVSTATKRKPAKRKTAKRKTAKRK